MCLPEALLFYGKWEVFLVRIKRNLLLGIF